MNATEKRLHAAALRLFAARGGTNVTMSELAEEAGVARGTLYRNVESVEQLFVQARTQLVADLHDTNARVMDADRVLDPPLRLATGIRMIVRRAHEDPTMGRFLVQFGMTDGSLREALSGPPMRDVEEGIRTGRYTVAPDMAISLMSLVIGAVVSAMWTVLEGHQTWREAGTVTAELILRAFGVRGEEAAKLASGPLPELPAL
ncbi:TetR/AcrR family transcriptional regulator [Kutzneria chonburiensis]|uniref:TetR/AcrR family transcriptional regulator n=1 Tax=Kutzneria chonburiensis TaxID=1483604 RepID=A0ABV6MSA4_9PSEU|nr:TetR/AcrR family transcriptional regulator [Kutzneria chonburiensis]